MPALDQLGRAEYVLRRGVLVLSYALPAILAVHAVIFWGRGIVAKETSTLVLNYLADRPLSALVMDPGLSDWGLYQARELSYVFDLIDARFFAALLDHGVLLLIPLSGVLGLAALMGVYLVGATRVLGLPGVSARLLLALFLSCIVTQASTAMLYRSAKIVLSVTMLAFFFQAWRLLRAREETSFSVSSDLSARDPRAPVPREVPARPVRAWPGYVLLFSTGVAMALCDRMGFFYLALATGLLACLPFRTGIGSSRGRRVIATSLLALAAALVYNHLIGPALIHSINGYRPDFEYQRLDWSDGLSAGLFARAGEMLLGQARYFLGSLPLVVTLIAGSAILALGLAPRARTAGQVERRRPSLAPLAQTVLVLAATVVLLALMILRHPPLYSIPDHSLRYYGLPIGVTFLLLCTVFASSPAARGNGRVVMAGHVLILVMIANNALHYAEQRESMVASPWLSIQHADSRSILDDFAAERGRMAAVGPEPWFRATPEGGVVELPLGDDSFVESVRAAYASLRHRRPWMASGTQWPNLRRFLANPASPLAEPELLPELVEGLRRIGIRRIHVRPARYESPEMAEATIAALRGATSQIRAVSETPEGPEFELLDWQPPQTDERSFIPIEQATMRVTARWPRRTEYLLDGDTSNRWVGAKGPAWIRVELDRPRNVGRVRIKLGWQHYGYFPRELRIESEDGDGTRVLHQGSALPALVQGLLKVHGMAVIEIDLEPNRTTALVIHHEHPSRWAVNELELWESAEPED